MSRLTDSFVRNYLLHGCNMFENGGVMKKMKVSSIICLCIAVMVCAACNQTEDVAKNEESPAVVLKGDYLGQTPPGDTPQLFAPGFISTGLYERDVAMTPEGDELYFGLLSGGYATICVTKRVDGVWTTPVITPFCDNDDVLNLEGYITPDGKKFLFLSTRTEKQEDFKPGWQNQDIWAMDRAGDGWGAPYNLGPPVNSADSEYFPSVTRDGTLYFSRGVEEDGARKHFVMRSRLVDGKYAEPEMLPEAVNPGDSQYNAFIDPGERYLIVGIAGLEDNIGQGDYYVCFRSENDEWTDPINMGEKINTPTNHVVSPYVSPDGKYFFFASNRQDKNTGNRTYDRLQKMITSPQNGDSDIYWIDASFIETLRPQ